MTTPTNLIPPKPAVPPLPQPPAPAPPAPIAVPGARVTLGAIEALACGILDTLRRGEKPSCVEAGDAAALLLTLLEDKRRSLVRLRQYEAGYGEAN